MDGNTRPVTGYPAPGQSNPNSYSTATTTAGIAYPYAVPPQTQPTYYNPNPYYQPQPYAAQRATFIRRIFALLIASVIITIVIIFIVWLILRPQIPEFRVDSLNLSNFNLTASNSLITGNWDVRFTVRNPNKKITLSYDHIAAAVYYKSESLSETTIPPFFQGKRNETTVRATFAAASAYVDRRVVDGINGDRGSHGSVIFIVRMLARVRFKAGAWRGRRRFLRVVCGDLLVGVSSNSAGGSLIGGLKQCRVGL